MCSTISVCIYLSSSFFLSLYRRCIQNYAETGFFSTYIQVEYSQGLSCVFSMYFCTLVLENLSGVVLCLRVHALYIYHK